MSESIKESTDSNFVSPIECVELHGGVNDSTLRKLGGGCLEASLEVNIDNAMGQMIDAVFQNDETREARNARLMNRANIIDDMVERYVDHPYVDKVVASHCKRGVVHYTNDTRLAVKRAAGSYDMLSSQEFKDYFYDIEAGLQLHASGVDLDYLNPEQEQIFLDMVAARQSVFATNLRLVVAMAKKYEHTKFPGLAWVDVIQEGNFGLSKAISRYDVHKGFEFSTYATAHIIQAMSRAIGDQARTIRTPVHQCEQASKISKSITKHQIELGRDLTDQEIEDISGMSVAEYAEFEQRHQLHLPSLNSHVCENGAELGELQPDRSKSDHDSLIDEVAYKQTLDRLFSKVELVPRVKAAVGLFYGIEQFAGGDFCFENPDGTTLSYAQAFELASHKLSQTSKDLTNTNIGEILGISRELARQYVDRGLRELKKVAEHAGYESHWSSSEGNGASSADIDADEAA